eukprot:6192462-Pleurochrysis_carterae.AAC.1
MDESIELMRKARELWVENRTPEPPPSRPLLDSFAKLSKANSSAPDPSQPVAISIQHVSEKSVPSPRRKPSDHEQVCEAELDAYVAAQVPAIPNATTPAASPKSPQEILRKQGYAYSEFEGGGASWSRAVDSSCSRGWPLPASCHYRLSHAKLEALCDDTSWSAA